MESASAGTRRLVITAVLIAISIVLSIPLNMGPFISLGFITFGAIAITILHVPAIIGAVLEGPVVGAIVGGAFGLFSLFLASQQPAGSPNAIFVDPIISVLPRLFIGPVAWLVYRALNYAPQKSDTAEVAITRNTDNTVVMSVMTIPSREEIQQLFVQGDEALTKQLEQFIAHVNAIIKQQQEVVKRLVERIHYVSLVGAGLAGTLTNTLLVIGAIAWRLKVPFFPTLASVSINVVLELIVSAVIVVAVVSALRGSGSGKQGSSV